MYYKTVAIREKFIIKHATKHDHSFEKIIKKPSSFKGTVQRDLRGVKSGIN
jgi:hypothetical protein